MPRPQKKRRVCAMPHNTLFAPNCPASGSVVLQVDEYEVIRLIDWEGCTQEECAAQMQVSRTTVQGIYERARRQIADALVHGKSLTISGGDYTICEHCGKHCREGKPRCCHRKQCRQKNQEESL